ncbi:MAG: MFS transporter [Candidatus Promineifilaceae bacterium]
MRRPSPKIILAVIAFGVFVAADDLTVVSTMLRQIIFDLEIPLPAGLNDAAWIVNSYLIAYVVIMPFVGRLSDIIGRRPVFITSLTLFLIGSIWLPNAPDLPTFIAGRVLTALGGGAMVPVGMAVIGDIFPPEKRPSALGILGAIDTAGWVWGPLYGALLVSFLSWRWQFYLNIPLSIIGIAAAWWALQDLPKPQRRAGLDWLGTAVLTITLIALNIALLNSGNIQSVSTLNQLSDSDPPLTWPLYILAAVGIIAFIIIERRLAKRQYQPSAEGTGKTAAAPPLIDPSLFQRPNFSPAIIINFLVGMVLIIAMINVPLLINVLEFDLESAALTSGLLLSAMTAAMAITAYLGGRLTERWHYRPVTWLGLGACVIGFGLMGLSWEPTTPYLQMAWQLAVLGAGFGLVTAPIGTAVINAAPGDQRGIAASLVIVLRLMGMSVGLSGLTAWGLYRFDILRMQIELPPFTDPGYPSAVTEALTNTTVMVLTETFLISAVIAALAFLVVFRLRKR